jgi:hypothetical protein
LSGHKGGRENLESHDIDWFNFNHMKNANIFVEVDLTLIDANGRLSGYKGY